MDEGARNTAGLTARAHTPRPEWRVGIGLPASVAEERNASVSIVIDVDGDETEFTRSISHAGVGEYRLNGKVVKFEKYTAKLKEFNIITKAHVGFLVFQARAPRSRAAARERDKSRCPTPMTD